MPHQFSCYLRLLRRQWALTQREVARLFRLATTQHVSRVERGKRKPSVHTLIAAELIFGKHPREIFPAIFHEIEKHVVEELKVLADVVCGDDSPIGQRKCALVTEAIERAVMRTNKKEHDQ